MGSRESQFDGSFYDGLMKAPAKNEEIPSPSELGSYIKGRRELIGAGVRQLARVLDCSPATITQIEKGKLTPGYDLAVKIAVTLDVNGAPTDKDKVLLMAGHTPEDCEPETVDECEAIRKVLGILRGKEE